MWMRCKIRCCGTVDAKKSRTRLKKERKRTAWSNRKVYHKRFFKNMEIEGYTDKHTHKKTHVETFLGMTTSLRHLRKMCKVLPTARLRRKSHRLYEDLRRKRCSLYIVIQRNTRDMHDSQGTTSKQETRDEHGSRGHPCTMPAKPEGDPSTACKPELQGSKDSTVSAGLHGSEGSTESAGSDESHGYPASDVSLCKMNIFVKTLTGRSISMEVNGSETVNAIKERIAVKEGIPTNQQRIIFESKNLDDACSLASYGIHRDSTVSLLLRLNGGVENESDNVYETTNEHGSGMCGHMGLGMGRRIYSTTDLFPNCETDGTHYSGMTKSDCSDNVEPLRTGAVRPQDSVMSESESEDMNTNHCANTGVPACPGMFEPGDSNTSMHHQSGTSGCACLDRSIQSDIEGPSRTNTDGHKDPDRSFSADEEAFLCQFVLENAGCRQLWKKCGRAMNKNGLVVQRYFNKHLSAAAKDASIHKPSIKRNWSQASTHDETSSTAACGAGTGQHKQQKVRHEGPVNCKSHRVEASYPRVAELHARITKMIKERPILTKVQIDNIWAAFRAGTRYWKGDTIHYDGDSEDDDDGPSMKSSSGSARGFTAVTGAAVGPGQGGGGGCAVPPASSSSSSSSRSSSSSSFSSMSQQCRGPKTPAKSILENVFACIREQKSASGTSLPASEFVAHMSFDIQFQNFAHCNL